MNAFKRLWKALKRVENIDRINEDIYETKKALITNQSTAEHYQALANGNLSTLERLVFMREQELKLQAPTATPPAKRPAKVVVEKKQAQSVEKFNLQTAVESARGVKTKLHSA